MSDRGSDKRDEAATRRRWISLAEMVAIAGVFIAGLTLFLSWTDKHEEREQRAEQTAEKQQQARAGAAVTLRATREKGGGRLTVADSAHQVDAIQVAFPTALKVGAREAVVEPAIQADWFKDELLALTDGGNDKASGKLPVLITSTYWNGDTKQTDRSIYDVIWRTEGKLLGGRSFKLEGIVLRERGGDQKRLDTTWADVRKIR